MQRWIAGVVTLLLVPPVVALHADESASQNRLAGTEWIRFEVVLGRIRVLYLRGGLNETVASAPDNQSGDAAPHEVLVLKTDSLAPSLRYERREAASSFQLEALGTTTLNIRHECAASSRSSFVWRQSRHGDLQIEFGPTGGTGVSEGRLVRAASLWHLLLTEPDAEQSLRPALELMGLYARVHETLLDTEDLLVTAARRRQPPSRVEIGRLVAMLGAVEFRERQRGERQLLELGVEALPTLESLDRNLLSREQLARIDRLCGQIALSTPDTPARIAAWLMEDIALWARLQQNADDTIRMAAVDYYPRLTSASAAAAAAETARPPAGSQPRLADRPRLTDQPSDLPRR